MNRKSPVTPEDVESLVRGHLKEEASQIDVAAALSSLQARIHRDSMKAAPSKTTPLRQATSSRGRTISWSIAVAAAVMIGLMGGGYFFPSVPTANAYTLVKEAHSALDAKVDRCYQVESNVPKAWLKNYPLVHSNESTIVWTRGDRFHVTSIRNGRRIEWGQDSDRRLWVIIDPDHGLIFEKGEAPEMLARPRQYLGLNLKRLAAHFLDDFDLRIDRKGGSSDHRVVSIKATKKPSIESLPFENAEIELDAQAKTIQKLVLIRNVKGKESGRFTFTLIEQHPQSDDYYSLAKLLPDHAKIFGSQQAIERNKWLDELAERKN